MPHSTGKTQVVLSGAQHGGEAGTVYRHQGGPHLLAYALTALKQHCNNTIWFFQVHSMVEKLAQSTDIRAALVVGGLSLQVQASTLKTSPEIVVATPVRVLSLCLQTNLPIKPHILLIIPHCADVAILLQSLCSYAFQQSDLILFISLLCVWHPPSCIVVAHEACHEQLLVTCRAA